MEFCQLQLNYLDWTFQGAKEKRTGGGVRDSGMGDGTSGGRQSGVSQ